MSSKLARSGLLLFLLLNASVTGAQVTADPPSTVTSTNIPYDGQRLSPSATTSQWARDFGVPGLYGLVRCAQEFRGELYVGTVSAFESTIVNGLAKWDGHRWVEVPNWPGGEVHTMAVHRGHLILAVGSQLRRMTKAGFEDIPIEKHTTIQDLVSFQGHLYLASPGMGNSVRVWSEVDGWSDVPNLQGWIADLVVYRNQLIAIGSGLRLNGGTTPTNVAVFDGESWTAIYPLLQASHRLDPVEQKSVSPHLATVHAGKLIVIMDEKIMSWNGVEWMPLVGNAPVLPRKLYSVGGTLFLEGANTTAVDDDYLYTRTNGQWIKKEKLSIGPGGSSIVWGLGEYQGKLVVVGSFFGLGGTVSAGIVLHNGESTERLRSPGPALNGIWGAVLEMTTYRGELIASGQNPVFGESGITEIAAWGGTEWRPLGEWPGGYIRGMEVLRDELYVVGHFEVESRYAAVMVWNGETWRPMESTVSDQPVTGLGCTQYRGDLVLHMAEDSAWNDSRVVLCHDGTLQDTGIRTNNQSVEMTVYQDELVVFLGDPYAIAWDGTNRSTPFSSGLGGRVYSTAILDGKLMIGGTFSSFIWDGEDLRWWTFQEGLSSPRELLVHDETLFAFTFDHDWRHEPQSDWWTYREGQWNPMDDPGGRVWDALVMDETLVVCGNFLKLDDVVSLQIGMRALGGIEQRTFATAARIPGVRDLANLSVSPNPCNPATSVSFEIFQSSKVMVSVYDSTGRRVWDHDLGVLDPGTHSVVWRGEDARGTSVASGVYYLRVDSGQSMLSAKLTILE